MCVLGREGRGRVGKREGEERKGDGSGDKAAVTPLSIMRPDPLCQTNSGV